MAPRTSVTRGSRVRLMDIPENRSEQCDAEIAEPAQRGVSLPHGPGEKPWPRTQKRRSRNRPTAPRRLGTRFDRRTNSSARLGGMAKCCQIPGMKK